MILRFLLTGTTLLLLTLVASVGAAASAEPNSVPLTALENVRAYAAAARADGRSYAVDAGRLYRGSGGVWELVAAPPGVVVNAVVVDRADPDTVVIGAANKLSVYVSRNAGRRWTEAAMDTTAVGGVTALALDAANRLLYVGTDADGVYRLRDLGAGSRSGLIASGHLLLNEPVLEIAADSTGAGFAFVRTQGNLYRAEAFGLRWVAVDSLPALPTALDIADTSPPTVFVGTAGAGVVVSRDGVAWRSTGQATEDIVDGRSVISDLAVDAAQPEVVYAGSVRTASGDLHPASSRVAMSTDGGASWSTLAELDELNAAELLPVAGTTGAVYVLTTASRRPLAVGGEPPLNVQQSTERSASGLSGTQLLAWILAGNASAALVILAFGEFKGGARRLQSGPHAARQRTAVPPVELGTLQAG